GISQQYSLTTFTETVNVAVVNHEPGSTLGNPSGNVVIKDGEQMQTVHLDSNGDASAKFVFNLFQNPPSKAHTVTADYSDPTGNSAPSAASPTAPDTTSTELFVFVLDVLILESLKQAFAAP